MRAVHAMTLAIRMVVRAPGRAALVATGIAIACFLLCAGRVLEEGVREATEAGARDARLVVYRANRFCPFTSRLPERYAEDVARVEGVRSVLPLQIVVSNCRASLDVVVFRGIRREDAPRILGARAALVSGSLEAFLAREDAALVGRSLAERRGLSVGDRLTAAGVSVVVAGVFEGDGAQDRNACYAQLAFLQSAAGGARGGDVTQLEVEVDDPSRRDEVAAAIDARFASDAAPTSTRPEKAFAARAAQDLVVLGGFAGWLGLGALAAVFGLVANAIMLALEGRVRQVAILQSIGFPAPLVALSIVGEGVLLALVGGAAGAGAAMGIVAAGDFCVGAEGIVVEFRPSAGAALASIGAALATGALASLAPAVLAARRSIVEGLRCD